jgi:hypothetical protein
MLKNDYLYSLLLYRADGSALGSAKVTVDWEPAAEWARFQHARQGTVPMYGEDAASIEPVWDKVGEPYVKGFRVVYESGGRKAATDFGTSYFGDVAGQTSAEFVRRGKLEAGDTYLFQTVAFAKNGNGNHRADGIFLEVVEEKPVLEFVESDLVGFRRGSSTMGLVDEADMPVFVPQRVLDEAEDQTRARRGSETGGVLIGRLHSDTSVPEIFAEVTAQIPAEHTLGTNAKLTFTAETWSAASTAIRLRNQGEIYLGYWHSHPVFDWCRGKGCSLEKQKTCHLAKDFFSEDDVAVMRAVFPRAYSIGIVANDTAFADVNFSLFGWREGRIHPRGFYLLEEPHA